MAPTLTIPVTATELEEMLNDAATLQSVLADEATRKEFFQKYAVACMNRDGTLAEQIREQVNAILPEFLEANGAKTEVPAALRQPGENTRVSRGKGAAYNKLATGVRGDGIFSEGGEFVQAIARHLTNIDQAERARLDSKLAKLQNSYGTIVPADGGFLVPEEFRSDLLMVALEMSVVRQRATVLPMSSLRLIVPSIDSTSNVSSVFGGVTVFWGEESAALTESQASFGRTQLDAKKLTAFSNVPNELLADAPAFGAFFDQTFPQAIAFFEDVAFFTGSGVGEPLGFIGCPATQTVTAQAGQATKTIVWENLVAMYARMLPTSLNRAVWIASPDTFTELATMALSVGTGGGPVWIGGPNQPGSDGPPVSILGRPLLISEKASTLGTAGDISFVDLAYYLIGDRQEMVAAASPHYKFANDQTSYRAIQRVDGRPWLQSGITPNNGGNALSAFVNLASR